MGRIIFSIGDYSGATGRALTFLVGLGYCFFFQLAASMVGWNGMRGGYGPACSNTAPRIFCAQLGMPRRHGPPFHAATGSEVTTKCERRSIGISIAADRRRTTVNGDDVPAPAPTATAKCEGPLIATVSPCLRLLSLVSLSCLLQGMESGRRVLLEFFFFFESSASPSPTMNTCHPTGALRRADQPAFFFPGPHRLVTSAVGDLLVPATP